ncbi:FAD-binding oxidoreductase [Anaeromyxobacter diazotrophicus]|uniref:FAD-linked oxidase n=1 Tax=Anaeromyxobacter diazotrophicus TaxID=2590199 RepID=A0A7I9VJ13_9BACT|nr:FAD-binding oxidoreductase [Anaeromyxobacter diazotrophicus]GEJ56138.1 FAD-linked oxidase [Anaeromyxobacter diazotrophicus]
MVALGREGTPADAILGVVPREVVEPATLDEAAEVLAACARDGRAVAFVGGGTELELGAPPRRLDVLLRTARLARVVEHAPADQIAVVEAGLPLGELQRRLRPHRQRLALDPPLAERATVGGVVAANAYGPRRHRFGAARDLVVGMSFVRADGVLAKGGGKVVKNVAGFDVPRLLVGSLGTLALIGTVTFRLHPLPEADRTVLVPMLDAGGLRALAAALGQAQLEPSAAAALLTGDGFQLALRFEGFPPGVAEQAQRLFALCERLGHGVEPLEEEGARAFWARHNAARSGGALRARLTFPRTGLEPAERLALRPLLASLGGAAAAIYPTLGVAFASGEPADPGAAARAVTEARAALAAAGGSLVVGAAPAEVRARVDPWGPPPPGLSLMRRVKAQLDPEERLAPGRFVGGI